MRAASFAASSFREPLAFFLVTTGRRSARTPRQGGVACRPPSRRRPDGCAPATDRLAAPPAVAVRADGTQAGTWRARPTLDRTGAKRPGYPPRPARLLPGNVRQGGAHPGYRGIAAVPRRRAGAVVAGQPCHARGARSPTGGADPAGEVRREPGRVRPVHAGRTRGGGARDGPVPHARPRARVAAQPPAALR